MGLGPPRRPGFYAQVLPREVTELCTEAGLSIEEGHFLVWLALLVTKPDEFPPKEPYSKPFTLRGLASHLGLGWWGCSRMIERLQVAGLVKWAPIRGYEGELSVCAYDRIMGLGRVGLEPWVAIYPHLLDDFCWSRQLKWLSRLALLQCLLKADDKSHVVGRTVSAVAAELGMSRARAKGLDGELHGAVEWGPGGLRVRIYNGVVASGPSLYVGKGCHQSRERTGRTGGAVTNRDWGVTNRASEQGEQGVLSPIARPVSSIARPLSPFARATRDFMTDQKPLNPSPLPPSTEDGSRPSRPKEAAADLSEKGLPLVTRLAQALGDRCGDLVRPTSYREAAQLEQRLAVLSESYSWTDLVHRAGDLSGVRSVAKVLLFRFNDLADVPGVVVSEESSRAAAAARRDEDLRRAEAFGITQARVLLANPGYELTDLVGERFPAGELREAAMAAAAAVLKSSQPAALGHEPG